eukprot:g19456.t1
MDGWDAAWSGDWGGWSRKDDGAASHDQNQEPPHERFFSVTFSYDYGHSFKHDANVYKNDRHYILQQFKELKADGDHVAFDVTQDGRWYDFTVKLEGWSGLLTDARMTKFVIVFSVTSEFAEGYAGAAEDSGGHGKDSADRTKFWTADTLADASKELTRIVDAFEGELLKHEPLWTLSQTLLNRKKQRLSELYAPSLPFLSKDYEKLKRELTVETPEEMKDAAVADLEWLAGSAPVKVSLAGSRLQLRFGDKQTVEKVLQFGEIPCPGRCYESIVLAPAVVPRGAAASKSYDKGKTGGAKQGSASSFGGDSWKGRSGKGERADTDAGATVPAHEVNWVRGTVPVAVEDVDKAVFLHFPRDYKEHHSSHSDSQTLEEDHELVLTELVGYVGPDALPPAAHASNAVANELAAEIRTLVELKIESAKSQCIAQCIAIVAGQRREALIASVIQKKMPGEAAVLPALHQYANTLLENMMVLGNKLAAEPDRADLETDRKGLAKKYESTVQVAHMVTALRANAKGNSK